MAKAKTEAAPTVEQEVKETVPIVDQSKVEEVVTETKKEEAAEPQEEEKLDSPYSEIEYRGSVIIVESFEGVNRIVVAKNGLHCAEWNGVEVEAGIKKAEGYINVSKR